MNPNVKFIITRFLQYNAYDGLCLVTYGETCGCELDHLMPCGSPEPGCECAYKDKDGLFYPGRKPGQKPPTLKEAIQRRDGTQEDKI